MKATCKNSGIGVEAGMVIVSACDFPKRRPSTAQCIAVLARASITALALLKWIGTRMRNVQSDGTRYVLLPRLPGWFITYSSTTSMEEGKVGVLEKNLDTTFEEDTCMA